MKLSSLQISLGLSLLAHGVIFSAFSFIQFGSGNSSQTSAVPISFVLISEPVSTDANTSNPKTIPKPHATAPTSSVLSSDEPTPSESQPVTPSPLPEVVSEDQTPQRVPSFVDDPSEEQVSSSSVAEDSGALPNSSSAPQAAPPTSALVASPGDSSSPAYLFNPLPRYPAKARARDEQGTVIIVLRVNTEGLPEDVGVRETSGFDVLDRAALNAVKTWRFTPARTESRRVETRVEIPIEFKLARTKTP